VASSPKSPEKQERLAAALRENLKRRKVKAREQASGAGISAPEKPSDSVHDPVEKASR